MFHLLTSLALAHSSIFVPPSGTSETVYVHPDDRHITLQLHGRYLTGHGTPTGISEPKYVSRDNRLIFTVTGSGVAGSFHVRFADRNLVLTFRSTQEQNERQNLLSAIPITEREHQVRQELRVLKKRSAELQNTAGDAKRALVELKEQISELTAERALGETERRQTRATLEKLKASLRREKQRRTKAEKEVKTLRKKIEDIEKKVKETEEKAAENQRLERESEKAGPGETSETVFFTPQYNSAEKLSENQLRLKVLFGYWDSVGNYFLARLQLRNRSGRPFCIGKPRTVVGKDLLETRITRLVGDRTLAAQGRVTVTVAIRRQAGMAFENLRHRIELTDCTGERSFVAHLQPWESRVIRIPVARGNGLYEWQQRERERTQLAMGPRFFGGAFWIPNGRTGDNRKLKATSFYGFGLRLNKGFNQTFAFEAEIVGGIASEATFDLDGQELKRKAKFGRAQLGGVLRFGYKGWIPIARAGIGVQGTSYDSETNGTQPDDGVEFSSLLAIFGGGVDFRTSEQFVIGLALSTVVATGGDGLSSFEAGVHIRYGWNP